MTECWKHHRKHRHVNKIKEVIIVKKVIKKVVWPVHHKKHCKHPR